MVVTNMVQQFSNSMDICKSCIHVYLISAHFLVFTICYIIRGPRFDEFAFSQNNFICHLLKHIQMESKVLRYENDMSENTRMYRYSKERFVDFYETRYMPQYEYTANVSLYLFYVNKSIMMFLISTESSIQLKGRKSYLIKINSYNKKRPNEEIGVL